MELKAKVIQCLPVETGEGKNGTWKSQKVIVEYGDKYPKKVCLKMLKDAVESVWEGDEKTFHIDVEGREYDGKWYIDVTCWKVE